MALDPVRLYDYLTQTRRKLLEWARPLSQEQYTQEFPFGLKTLRATLLEMARAEWIYTTRIAGTTVPPRDEWPIPEAKQPTFAELEKAWTALEPRTRALFAGIADWNQQRQWQSPVAQPGKRVMMSATLNDLASQFILHEVHHRAQAMAMLRQFGIPAQNLDFSAAMFTRREEPA
jgi:uncharacterized damage-inducible protein DinB